MKERRERESISLPISRQDEPHVVKYKIFHRDYLDVVDTAQYRGAPTQRWRCRRVKRNRIVPVPNVSDIVNN